MAKRKNGQQQKITGREGFLLSKKKKKTNTSINYQLLSFTEVPFYAFISYQ